MKFNPPSHHTCTVAVIGLGYVGLPLAVEFSKSKKCNKTSLALNRVTIGFDINTQRIDELRQGFDRTNEISTQELLEATHLILTKDSNKLREADVFIVTVPTPIDDAKKPDFTPLQKASNMLGTVLKNRSSTSSSPIVIYESTVYPGATEEICVPIIETVSGLSYNQDFFCGYSPERINPGDKQHRLTSITKVTSGSTPEVALWIDDFYASIITAGTYMAKSLKVAEAAKVIENTQRDLNIALINELAMIFRRFNIDTLDVLEAAGSKWNFLPFRPGLVGGHCIGVDPYYLTYKAEQVGYHPQILLAGRRINDGMGSWVVDQLVLHLAKSRKIQKHIKVCVMGFTFKENCPDIRNTRVIDIIDSLKYYDFDIDVFDPCANVDEAQKVYNIKLINSFQDLSTYNIVIAAVAHDSIKQISLENWGSILDKNGLIYDLKGFVPRDLNPIRL